MKYLKMLGLTALSAMALIAFAGAGTASAVTLEVGGVTKNEPVTITASLKTGTKAVLTDTFTIPVEECSASTVKGTSEAPYSGEKVTGPVEELTFTSCLHDPTHPVVVHNRGKLFVEKDPNTATNGWVYSEGAEVTVWSTTFNTYIKCVTAAGGTLIGTLDGVASGHATLTVNAVLSCGQLATAKWEGTYTVESALGVSP